jgi:hypothetical protein
MSKIDINEIKMEIIRQVQVKRIIGLNWMFTGLGQQYFEL